MTPSSSEATHALRAVDLGSDSQVQLLTEEPEHCRLLGTQPVLHYFPLRSILERIEHRAGHVGLEHAGVDVVTCGTRSGCC